MAVTPQFIGTPRIDHVNVFTANTALDGTGIIATLATGAPAGSRILEVIVKGAATTAAGVINLFISTDSGVTWRLFDSLLVSAITPSASVISFESSIIYANLLLKDATHRIGVTTTVAQSMNVIALGGDL